MQETKLGHVLAPDPRARETIPVGALDQVDLEAIAGADMAPEHQHLDRELECESASDVTTDIQTSPPGLQAQLDALDKKPDSDIDFSDAPERLDWSGAKRGLFCRAVPRADGR